MKGVRTQETNNSPCITRSKKKPNERDENDPFDVIPPDLKTELLMKLPPKSIARLIFVSKHWSSTISSKDFIELFLSRSTTWPRFLFTFWRRGKHFLHSCSEEDPSSDHHTVCLTTPYGLYHLYPWYKSSAPVRCLICCQDDTKVVICNPSTGQFLTLPRIKTWSSRISTFFGYDAVNDVYKVLCMTVIQDMPYNHIEKHQVFPLGGAQKRWRKIKCKHPHRSFHQSKGICKDGVVYYLALVKNKESIISFDLRTEDFNVIELPAEAYVTVVFDLVNYNGKIAIGNQWACVQNQSTFALWVLEDVGKLDWFKVSISFPSLRALFVDNYFNFRGRISTGELIFAPSSTCSSNPDTLLCYDLKKNNVKKVVIEGLGHGLISNVEVFLDHIESPMFLSKKLIR